MDEERIEQIQECIKVFKSKHGYLPTIREIGDWIGSSSTSHVVYQLERCPGVKRVKIGPSERSVRWDVSES